MKTIVKMIFGSHLYGTSTTDSDTDYKGVFMPSIDQVLLGRIPKSINTSRAKRDGEKNTSDDVDTEIYSLHYFIHLACEGETAALDMLHAPNEMIVESSFVWLQIVSNRRRFYTKNLKAFVGYARRQAAKYGIKGSRLNDAASVLQFCAKYEPNIRLKEVWDKLPIGEHLMKIGEDANGFQVYEVCGKKYGENARLSLMQDSVAKFHKNYGERAMLAARNEGIDWKAVSHALRAAYQTKALLTKGDIVFPLPEAQLLLDVKCGRLDYLSFVAPLLDGLMDEIEELSRQSTLPQKVDRGYWDRFITDVLKKEYNGHLYA